jgi:hypothetical protein
LAGKRTRPQTDEEISQLPFDTDEQIDAQNAIVRANECQRLSRDVIPVEEEEAESANWVPYIYYSVYKGHAFVEGAFLEDL